MSTTAGHAGASSNRTNPAAGAPQAVTLQAIGLALVRILTGYLWFTQILWKTPPNFAAFHFWTVKIATYSWLPIYRSLVHAAVLREPNFTVVGYLTFALESLIALSLLFGVFTRLGAIVGALWAAQLYVGLTAVPGEWYWTYAMLVMLNAVLALTPSGAALSVDQWLRLRVSALAAGGGRLARFLSWAQ
jgi:hypothetical protein